MHNDSEFTPPHQHCQARFFIPTTKVAPSRKQDRAPNGAHSHKSFYLNVYLYKHKYVSALFKTAWLDPPKRGVDFPVCSLRLFCVLFVYEHMMPALR